MRPKKTRWVQCEPGVRCFRPQCKKRNLEGVVLGFDEFEALRLAYLEGMSQKEIAEAMGVHQSTVSRMMVEGNKKIMDALVNIKAIRIEKGCCEIVKRRRQ